MLLKIKFFYSFSAGVYVFVARLIKVMLGLSLQEIHKKLFEEILVAFADMNAEIVAIVVFRKIRVKEIGDALIID